MENTTKKDPRDYTLRELPALCASMKDCERCPIDRLRGPCQGGNIPAEWDLDDLAPGLTAAIQGIAQAFRAVAEYIQDNCAADDADEYTETVTTYGGDTITVKEGRGRDDH